jgi:hypothetical protein
MAQTDDGLPDEMSMAGHQQVNQAQVGPVGTVPQAQGVVPLHAQPHMQPQQPMQYQGPAGFANAAMPGAAAGTVESAGGVVLGPDGQPLTQ